MGSGEIGTSEETGGMASKLAVECSVEVDCSDRTVC